MAESAVVVRMRELITLGLTAQEAVAVKFALVAPYIPAVVAAVQGPPHIGFTEGYDPLPAVQALGDTGAQAHLRLELAQVFESTGTRSLEELYAYLEQES